MDKKAYDLNYMSFQIYDLKYMIFWSNIKWSQIYVVPNIWFQIKKPQIYDILIEDQSVVFTDWESNLFPNSLHFCWSR